MDLHRNGILLSELVFGSSLVWGWDEVKKVGKERQTDIHLFYVVESIARTFLTTLI